MTDAIFSYIYIHVHSHLKKHFQVGLLMAFSTPTESFAKTIMQTAGELDYGTIFEEDALLYTPMAYILFILFVILMPVLFNNLLVRSVRLSKFHIEYIENS